jgi:hypothetical protein
MMQIVVRHSANRPRVGSAAVLEGLRLDVLGDQPLVVEGHLDPGRGLIRPRTFGPTRRIWVAASVATFLAAAEASPPRVRQKPQLDRFDPAGNGRCPLAG